LFVIQQNCFIAGTLIQGLKDFPDFGFADQQEDFRDSGKAQILPIL